MNLYTQAESNTRRTWLLIATFLVLIIGLGWLFSYIWNDQVILYFAVILSVGMSFSSYWYSDKIVLSMMKAKPIEEKDNRDLYHVVENLCIAAGLPVPKIFIIEEQQPNAFATGRDAKHAVIAVTRGLLNKLEKSELEGVIAHELSHIGNKDMLLGTVVVVLVGIIAMLSNWFMRIGFHSKSDSDNKQAAGLFMLFGVVAAILAPIAAKIIQLSISRKREFLADTDGALLTRYPEGLARALEKISTDATPLKVANNATNHLFIASPLRGKQASDWFTKLFMTHPPISDRVKALRGMSI